MKEERRNRISISLFRLDNHILIREKGFYCTWIAWIVFEVVRINFVVNRNDFLEKINLKQTEPISYNYHCFENKLKIKPEISVRSMALTIL